VTPLELPRGLGRPAERALKAAGIRDLADLAQHSREEIADLHGVGPKAIGVLVTALAAHGLSFRAAP
jgi:predicted flap endonuclease-1-like 5' DNA nuclease